MADDLEAFLRQAAQRRAQRQQPPGQRPPAPAPRPAAPAPPPRSIAREPLVAPKPVAAPVPELVVAEAVPRSEIARVGTRVSTAEFEQRAEHLGEEVGLADEHMDAHIAQKFDHQVGTLDLDGTAQAGATAAETAFDVADLVAMLHDPKTLRHAVVLSEILNPPHFSR